MKFHERKGLHPLSKVVSATVKPHGTAGERTVPELSFKARVSVHRSRHLFAPGLSPSSCPAWLA